MDPLPPSGDAGLDAARQLEVSARGEILARYEARRRQLALAERAREADLPLRLLRQASHLTTPASSLEKIRKAAAGLAPVGRMLAKLSISTGDLGAAFGCDPALVASVLASGATAGLVLVDGEDATALDPLVQRSARANAIEAFTTIDWGRSLAFYRPTGLALDSCVEDLVTVISETAARAGRRFPIDGVVWPKANHEDELVFLDDLLSELEGACGLPLRTIRVAFLIESGRGLARLERLVDAILPRLSAVIWGIADYAADVGLPTIRNDHPSCDLVRAAIVNISGSVGVPAIDAMTFDYPVSDPGLDAAANREKVLRALATSHRDARHGIALGMDGKWVGHPLQLLANEVAFRSALDPATVEKDVADSRAYLAALARGQGAAVIAGGMADRATDRHVRRRLRKALAQGALGPEVARELGLMALGEAG